MDRAWPKHTATNGSCLSTHIQQIAQGNTWAALCLLQEFARFMCQEVWEQRCSGCGGWNSDRAWEFLCNLLTRDFAYLSILYGSRKEIPTSLIECIVQFCWELLIIVHLDALRYSDAVPHHAASWRMLTVSWCFAVSWGCTVSECCTALQYSAVLAYQDDTHSHSILLTARGGTKLQLFQQSISQTPLRPLQLDQLQLQLILLQLYALQLQLHVLQLQIYTLQHFKNYTLYRLKTSIRTLRSTSTCRIAPSNQTDSVYCKYFSNWIVISFETFRLYHIRAPFGVYFSTVSW